ncbi:MAG: ABC transporter permease [Aphanocapsa sp. GSE-SYN-MK-11-07L]|jgi:lipopolysaccharide transport system permease protein|nr:ABC transporter permease [Aphanocapsa sp. GSE-SYN-MK-11-07L]
MSEAPQRLVIKAGHTRSRYWKDLWRFRELLYFLAWRDILVRYKQTTIGIAWALIRPLLTIVIFTVVFGAIAKLPSGNIPYPILVCAALLPWQFFADALSRSGASLLANAHLISKVYFPRLIVPLSAVFVSLVDFLVSVSILLGLMVWYNFMPSWRILALPLLLMVTAIAALGVGLWFAALSVKYRDFQFVLPFLIQLGFFISPVGFSSSVIAPKWRLLYSLNPMVGIIDGFRWAILGTDIAFYWQGFLVSMLLLVIIFSSGIWFFRKTERSFADVI